MQQKNPYESLFCEAPRIQLLVIFIYVELLRGTRVGELTLLKYKYCKVHAPSGTNGPCREEQKERAFYAIFKRFCVHNLDDREGWKVYQRASGSPNDTIKAKARKIHFQRGVCHWTCWVNAKKLNLIEFSINSF